ncbi:MAG: preprotein translocase subunit SecA [Bacteroides sp.]|nr:preprotein translocase subunit SecA [Bacteroides sp.]MCM1086289.1 preprotein translocase subunit SecA [Bacteroides sp.]
MASFFKKLLGNKSDRDLKEVRPILEKCLAAYETISQLDNDGLRAKTQEFKERINARVKDSREEVERLKERIRNNIDDSLSVEEKEHIYASIDRLEKEIYNQTQEELNAILPEAFAVVKATAQRFASNAEVEVTAMPWDGDLAATRDNVSIRGNKAYYKNQWMAGGNLITWDMVHYDVQLIGGIVLHQGKIAEMSTGEGKTLVETLPVYLNALPGQGVHVVTVNDYLAKRDSEWMGMLFEFHGLKVDCIDKHQPSSEARRQAYLADITYGTNNEFGFDYLRDNMCRTPQELVQRGHNYAIVDEVDSVLIDDARTPLIISGPTTKDDDLEFDTLRPQIEKLYNQQRALVTKILAEAKGLLNGNPTPEQEKKGGELLFRAHRGLPKNTALIKFLSEPGMKTLMQKTENFYLQEQGKNMPKIDGELYFVIDEKLNTIDLTDKGVDYLSSDANNPEYYILPDVGSQIAELERSGLSPEEKTARKTEIMRDYAIQSDRVHTINQLLKAYALFERDVEYVVIDNEVKIVDEQTGRIMEGRRYSDGLHQAIEAKERVKVEASTQTYATITLQNYFRMYSKLSGMTGTAETEAGEFWNIYKLEVVCIPTNRPVIREDMDDLIYKTKREKYNAIIEEVERLIGAGRPVLVGTTSVEVSELLSRMLKGRNIKHNVLNAKLHKKEADIVAEAGLAGTVTIATNMAGRGTDIKLGPGVKEAGGLAIIGTERHESRRVDRQLRGRAGRQGDPGSSQFYVSLEDNLMRLFASQRIAALMDRMGYQEGENIQAKMLTRSIEKAQKKVEENHFGTRKRLLEYDDVMNAQREVIYTKRRHALFGERLGVDISNMMYDTVENYFSDLGEDRDFENFKSRLIRTFGVECPVSEAEALSGKADTVKAVYEAVYNAYRQKAELIAQQALPIIQHVHDSHGSRFENIAIPITDGRKTLQVVANIQKCLDSNGREITGSIQRGLCLAMIDDAWKEHLREMDDLKQSVQNASYEQKDPLLIYKFEAFNLFKQLLIDMNRDVSEFLSLGHLPSPDPSQMQEARQQRTDMSRMQTSRAGIGGAAPEQRAPVHTNQPDAPQKPQPVHVEKKVGRNDPCPCGSGKKYKNCHGKNLA